MRSIQGGEPRTFRLPPILSRPDAIITPHPEGFSGSWRQIAEISA
jgi:hypothetical protein